MVVSALWHRVFLRIAACTFPAHSVFFASGNAYPVPCIIPCFHDMVVALANFDLLSWPPHDMAGVGVPVDHKPFKELLAKPGRVNKAKAKAAAAREKAKAAPRRLKRKSSFFD